MGSFYVILSLPGIDSLYTLVIPMVYPTSFYDSAGELHWCQPDWRQARESIYGAPTQQHLAGSKTLTTAKVYIRLIANPLRSILCAYY